MSKEIKACIDDLHTLIDGYLNDKGEAFVSLKPLKAKYKFAITKEKQNLNVLMGAVNETIVDIGIENLLPADDAKVKVLNRISQAIVHHSKEMDRRVAKAVSNLLVYHNAITALGKMSEELKKPGISSVNADNLLSKVKALSDVTDQIEIY